MLGRQEAVHETLRQIQVFLHDNETTLDTVNRSGARKRLDALVEQMAEHAIAQVGGWRTAQGETARQRQLRQTLRFDHMRPIAIIAKQMLREQPDFTLLRLPRYKVHAAGLTVAARDMANAADKYTELFVQEGLAEDFVAELRAAADRLEQSIDARGQSRVQRAGATEGLKMTTTQGRALIQLFDSLVRPKLGTNDELLREWLVAKHFQRARTAASATSGAEPPATATSSPALALVAAVA